MRENQVSHFILYYLFNRALILWLKLRLSFSFYYYRYILRYIDGLLL